ncbi:hypothetical protein JRO89_XS08G0023300 [Xanthoceras sorbifolium]|uniref:Uncharacterized protein n=1 Tax=Xanthoceras sorbifolium TaxID=99658 RepID=A0ABQ8HNI9_9ROSI|nr:hypothetical protein JRO89_XS08G0023300 [Xanthoceras sorbifolium]
MSPRTSHRSINSNDVLKLAADKDDVKDEIVMLSVGLIAGGSLPLRLPMKQNSSPNYILQIASLDLQGLTKRMKAVAKVLDEFMKKIIDEHVQSKDDSKTKDFVDLMLSFM